MATLSIAFSDNSLAVNPTWTALSGVTYFTIDRGRAYELNRTEGGTATVTLIDTTGAFDPTNTSGAYYPDGLNPMRQAKIDLVNPVDLTTTTIFRGFVSDWSIDMDVTGTYSRVTVELVDGFDLLAAAEVIPDFAGVAGPNDITGGVFPTESAGDVFYENGEVDDRIRAALADAGWPSGLTVIFSGNVLVQETVYPPRTQILSVIQDAADAEFPGVANVFMSKDGKVTFHGRLARFTPSDYGLNTWTVGGLTEANLDPTRAVLSGLTFNRGKTDLINASIATPQNILDADIAGQFVYDSTSIATYGNRSENATFENLLTGGGKYDGLDANQETLIFANYYKNNKKNPRTRVSQLVFRVQDPAGVYGPASWRLMCGVEISDVIALKTTHTGGGGFNESFYVEGIHYEASPLNALYHDITLTLDVSPAAYYTGVGNPFPTGSPLIAPQNQFLTQSLTAPGIGGP